MDATADQKIIALASQTGGVVTMPAMQAAGVSRWTVRRRVESEFLDRRAKGLFVVNALAADRTELWVAQIGSRGAISHESSLRLHGAPIPGRTVHVLVPKGTDNKAPGSVVHETRLWFDEDVTSVDGLAVTTPSRALIDVVRPLHERRWTSAAQRLIRDGSLDPDDLIVTFQRLDRNGRSRRKETASLIGIVAGDEAMSESVLERVIFDGLTSRGVPGLKRQFRPPWYAGIRGIIDIAEPIGKTIVEGDGRPWHLTTDAIENDHARDREGARHGFLTIRLGWREVTKFPERSLGEAAAIITARRDAALRLAS